MPEALGPCDLVAAGGVCGVVASRCERMDEPTRLEALGLLADADGRPLKLADFRIHPPPAPRRRARPRRAARSALRGCRAHPAAGAPPGRPRPGRAGASRPAAPALLGRAPGDPRLARSRTAAPPERGGAGPRLRRGGCPGAPRSRARAFCRQPRSASGRPLRRRRPEPGRARRQSRPPRSPRADLARARPAGRPARRLAGRVRAFGTALAPPACSAARRTPGRSAAAADGPNEALAEHRITAGRARGCGASGRPPCRAGRSRPAPGSAVARAAAGRRRSSSSPRTGARDRGG